MSRLAEVDRRQILGVIVRTVPVVAAALLSNNEYNTVNAVRQNAAEAAASSFPLPQKPTVPSSLVTQARRLSVLYKSLTDAENMSTSMSRRGFLGITGQYDDPITDLVLEEALRKSKEDEIRTVNDQIKDVRQSPQFQTAWTEYQTEQVVYQQNAVATGQARIQEENRLRIVQGVTSLRYSLGMGVFSLAPIAGLAGFLLAITLPIARGIPSWPFNERTPQPQTSSGEEKSTAPGNSI